MEQHDYYPYYYDPGYGVPWNEQFNRHHDPWGYSGRYWRDGYHQEQYYQGGNHDQYYHEQYHEQPGEGYEFDDFDGYEELYDEDMAMMNQNDEGEFGDFDDNRYDEMGSYEEENYPDVDDEFESQWQKPQNVIAYVFLPFPMQRGEQPGYMRLSHPRLQIPEAKSPTSNTGETELDDSTSATPVTKAQSPSDLFCRMFWKTAPVSPRSSSTGFARSISETKTSTSAQNPTTEESSQPSTSSWNGHVGYLAPVQVSDKA